MNRAFDLVDVCELFLFVVISGIVFEKEYGRQNRTQRCTKLVRRKRHEARSQDIKLLFFLLSALKVVFESYCSCDIADNHEDFLYLFVFRRDRSGCYAVRLAATRNLVFYGLALEYFSKLSDSVRIDGRVKVFSEAFAHPVFCRLLQR